MKAHPPENDGEAVQIRDVNELACDLTAKGVREIKTVLPDAAPTLTAIEQAVDYIRRSLNDGLDRDILIRVRPADGIIFVTSTIKWDPPDGAIQ